VEIHRRIPDTIMNDNSQIEDRFIVDRENDLVHDLATGEILELLQTQVSLLRNGRGKIIGVEVLHDCRDASDATFIIDATEIYDDEVEVQ